MTTQSGLGTPGDPGAAVKIETISSFSLVSSVSLKIEKASLIGVGTGFLKNSFSSTENGLPSCLIETYRTLRLKTWLFRDGLRTLAKGGTIKLYVTSPRERMHEHTAKKSDWNRCTLPMVGQSEKMKRYRGKRFADVDKSNFRTQK